MCDCGSKLKPVQHCGFEECPDCGKETKEKTVKVSQEVKKDMQKVVDAMNPCDGCGSLACEAVMDMAKKYDLTLRTKEERFHQGELFKKTA